MDKSGKILVIRFSSLGDLVLLTSLLELLAKKMPDYTIDLATKGVYADIFEGGYPVSRVFQLEENGFFDLMRLRRSLSKENYDYIIDAHNVIRSNILYHTIRADRKVQLGKDQLRKTILISQGKNLYGKKISQIDRYLDLAVRLGLEISIPVTKLVPSQENRSVADSIINSSGLAGKIIIAIAPGARWETKRWPAENFSKLLEVLSSEGYGTIIVGDESETELCRSIVRNSMNTIVTCGKLSIMETAAILSISNVLVTNDSASLHIAEAVGTPVVAMFGPTVMEFGYFPLMPSSRVLEVDLDCRPCSRNGSRPCKLARKTCLESIETDDVARAIDEVLRISGVIP